METFPSTALIRLRGFAEKRESALLRSDMESGPPKQAKIKTAVLVTRPVELLFRTKGDYLSFVSWYAVNINEGADWFQWTDPVSGTVKTARFAQGGFDAAPVSSTSGDWKISTSIETWG
ncbi:MAG TPA: hypothetical protein PLO14_03295 [Accumulibacter sp.]|uniref:hypothetical protein n=1 Tax=Accumulibacter sp. TaxID=2053492 RepID=UPI0025E22AE0|nr:hypothetical protein [Accumulibacter sp.]MCM8599907.1 hypothetical protein [Accumulibacter sp.]MCM8664091.1 hypothetical protein [Accumulibacter sp.]HNC51254.1 hypothetical protein [Accumulibacter sp.]